MQRLVLWDISASHGGTGKQAGAYLDVKKDIFLKRTSLRKKTSVPQAMLVQVYIKIETKLAPALSKVHIQTNSLQGRAAHKSNCVTYIKLGIVNVVR